MVRVKLIPLSVFAMVAVGAISASSASAEFTVGAKCEGAGIAAICLETVASEGLKEATGSEKFTLKLEGGTESLIEVPDLEGHIVCKETPGTGTAEQPSPLVTVPKVTKVVINFQKECRLLAPLAGKCKVKEPIITKPLSGEILPTEPRHIVLKPEAGTIFAEVTITNIAECPATVLGTSPIKGKILGLFLPEAETTDAVVQLLQFTHEANEENKLEFGLNPATLETEFEFEFEKKWLWDTVLA